MSDIKLFRYGQHGVSELEGKAAMGWARNIWADMLT